jgi:hypothetical protein
MELYGNPPQFPPDPIVEVTEEGKKEEGTKDTKDKKVKTDPLAFHSNKVCF